MRAGHGLATWTCRRQCGRASRGVDRYRTPFGVDRIRKKSQSPISSVRLRGNNVDAFLRARGRPPRRVEDGGAGLGRRERDTGRGDMSSSSRAADIAPPDGSDPAPAVTDTERRPETERADTRTSAPDAASAAEAASARASGDTTTLTTLGRDLECRERRADDGRRHAVARARARPRPRRGRRAGGRVPVAQPRQPQERARGRTLAERIAGSCGGLAEAEAARDAASSR